MSKSNAKILDLTGQRFGKLNALEACHPPNRKRSWLCNCDCGGQAIVETNLLTSGNTKSCGKCWRVKDEIGNRYGRLVVIARAETPRGRGAFWSCHCDCGKDIVTSGGSLRYGTSQSCGCLASEKLREAKLLPDGIAAMNQIIRRTRAQALERGYEYTLTREQLINLMRQDCYYCGSPPSNVSQGAELNGSFTYNGIDRIDNSKGYTIENVVPCCKHCNYAKRDRTTKEFLEWITRLYNHSILRQKEYAL